jgi:predicted RNase H-like HicB family nuclease
MHKYEIIIYWSNEDDAYIANANEAIRLWMDTAEEFGDPVPEPKGQRLMLA